MGSTLIVNLDDLTLFKASTTKSHILSTVIETSLDCLCFAFMVCLCSFYLRVTRRTDKSFIALEENQLGGSLKIFCNDYSPDSFVISRITK